MPPLSRGSKFFHHRSSTSISPLTHNSITLICCLLVGIAGLIFGIIAVTTTPQGHSYISRQPRTVSIVWDQGGNTTVDGGPGNERHKVKGFVGIFTGFSSVGRRQSLRQTWMPSDKQGIQSLEEATGLTFRFVIGRTEEMWKMSHLQKEIAEYDDFLLLNVEEQYSKLPYKTLAFFKAAYTLFDSEFYVKVDDDIYLRPDRLSLLLAKERSNPQTYIGCMKKGPVFKDPNLKRYEPLSYLLGLEYFLHAYGPIYALSVSVVRSLNALGNDSFRMFNNEDVTIGSWMLAMNVNFENNKALCEESCTSTAIAVWDIPQCSGLSKWANRWDGGE